MKQVFTGIYKKTGKWYSAWVEEVPGANTQGRTLKAAKANLREALRLILEANHALFLKQAKGAIRESLRV